MSGHAIKIPKRHGTPIGNLNNGMVFMVLMIILRVDGRLEGRNMVEGSGDILRKY